MMVRFSLLLASLLAASCSAFAPSLGKFPQGVGLLVIIGLTLLGYSIGILVMEDNQTVDGCCDLLFVFSFLFHAQTLAEALSGPVPPLLAQHLVGAKPSFRWLTASI